VSRRPDRAGAACSRRQVGQRRLDRGLCNRRWPGRM